jgi:dephospho-CoA kinase
MKNLNPRPTNEEFEGLLFIFLEVKLIKKEYKDETKKILEVYLDDSIIHERMNGKKTRQAKSLLGRFHHQMTYTLACNKEIRKNLQLSESYFKESVRIHTIIYGSNNCLTLDSVS